jgi:hypothetical protein
MPKRRRSRKSACQPCKTARTRRKRRGSPRFSKACRAEFKSCMRGELKSTGSLKTAGRTCMTVLQQCRAKRGR